MSQKNRERSSRDQAPSRKGGNDNSVGNQQRTSQTGGQSGGGQNRRDRQDAFSDDLNRSGQRGGSSGDRNR